MAMKGTRGKAGNSRGARRQNVKVKTGKTHRQSARKRTSAQKSAPAPRARGSAVAWRRKDAITRNYVEWFVTYKSGDARLAARLAREWHEGWQLMLKLFRAGKTSAEVAKTLSARGKNAILLGCGMGRFDLPGRTVSFLVLDRENCCKQIFLEQWTATAPDKITNVILIGMGQKDVNQSDIGEKQIHLCAFELPKAGDYLQISTQSISPLVKGIIVFAGVTLLAGCTNEAPPPPPAPVIPKDPTGTPGPHNVTSDNPANLPGTGIQLPTGRNGNPTLRPHQQPGIKSNVAPGVPANQWYWFWVFTVDVARFRTGCCFYTMVRKKVWLNGTSVDDTWHVDTPLPGNIWVDANGLHFIDTPGYAPVGPNPPPYDKEMGLGQFVNATDHVIITWEFRLYVWCPGEQVHEYAFSKTLEIDKGTLKNGTAFEKPRFLSTRPVTPEDRRHAVCPQ